MGSQAINEDIELNRLAEPMGGSLLEQNHESGQELHSVIHRGIGGMKRSPPFP